MQYIDAYVAAVPTANKDAYRAHTKQTAVVFKDHGAIKLVENWGGAAPDGELTSFPKAVQCKSDETVEFSWIIWPSKAVRDAPMEQAMSDPRLSDGNNPIPFDGTRLIYSGFETIVDSCWVAPYASRQPR